MTVYLSGPMSGYDDYNRPAFIEAEAAVKRAKPGWEVCNPARLAAIVEARCSGGVVRYEDYLRYDLRCLLDCDMVLMLPGWERSRGAQIEKRLAEDTGIPVYCDMFIVEEAGA